MSKNQSFGQNREKSDIFLFFLSENIIENLKKCQINVIKWLKKLKTTFAGTFRHKDDESGIGQELDKKDKGYGRFGCIGRVGRVGRENLKATTKHLQISPHSGVLLLVVLLLMLTLSEEDKALILTLLTSETTAFVLTTIFLLTAGGSGYSTLEPVTGLKIIKNLLIVLNLKCAIVDAVEQHNHNYKLLWWPQNGNLWKRGMGQYDFCGIFWYWNECDNFLEVERIVTLGVVSSHERKIFKNTYCFVMWVWSSFLSKSTKQFIKSCKNWFQNFVLKFICLSVLMMALSLTTPLFTSILSVSSSYSVSSPASSILSTFSGSSIQLIWSNLLILLTLLICLILSKKMTKLYSNYFTQFSYRSILSATKTPAIVSNMLNNVATKFFISCAIMLLLTIYLLLLCENVESNPGPQS